MNLNTRDKQEVFENFKIEESKKDHRLQFSDDHKFFAISNEALSR
jgi:hypothetical protein